MKKLLKFIVTIIFTFLMHGACYAQEHEVSIGDYQTDSSFTKTDKNNNLKLHLALINWLIPQSLVENPVANWQYSLFYTYNLRKSENPFNIGTGISGHTLNLHTRAKSWNFDTTYGYTEMLADTAEFAKNKTVLGYIGIPVEINFRFGLIPGRMPVAGIGIKPSYLVFSHFKYKKDDVKIKTRIRDNLNKVNIGLYAYLKYRYFDLYGEYSLTPVFKHENAPASGYWTIGLGIAL